MSDKELDGTGKEPQGERPPVDNRVPEPLRNFPQEWDDRERSVKAILAVGSASQKEQIIDNIRKGQVFSLLVRRKGYVNLDALSFVSRVPPSTLFFASIGLLTRNELHGIYDNLHNVFGDELPFDPPSRQITPHTRLV